MFVAWRVTRAKEDSAIVYNYVFEDRAEKSFELVLGEHLTDTITIGLNANRIGE